MIHEMAVGDAYGVAFEFVPHTPDRPNDLSGFHANPRYPVLGRGRYTDDTMRALANAEVVLRGDPYDALSYAEAYVRAVRADRRQGWSRRFQALIESCADDEPDDRRAGGLLLSRTRRDADSNGAVMGVVTLGYLPDPQAVALAAAVQAMTTHSVETVPYAQALALVAHHHLHALDGDVDDLVADHVSTRSPPSWRGTDREQSSMTARATYAAVRRALALNRTVSDVLRWSVARGGDTDSVAASAVALASVSGSHVSDLPAHLLGGVEDGPGRAGLAAMDDALTALLPSRAPAPPRPRAR